jgi:hypothetical protein
LERKGSAIKTPKYPKKTVSSMLIWSFDEKISPILNPFLLGNHSSHLDRFSKRMSEMTGERDGFSGKERARRLLEQ